jgi:hypothetical protein
MSFGIATAGLAELKPLRVRWERLEFRASKLTVTATTEVAIATKALGEVRHRWLEPTEGEPVMPQGSEVIHIQLGSLLLGKKSELDLWLDPVTGAAMQRTQLETGRKVRHNRHRSLRFTEAGIFNSTYRAVEETVDRPFHQWDLTEEFKEFPEEFDRAAVVTEPSALFYLLAVADLNAKGDQLATYMFSKGRVMQVRFVVVETTSIKANYTEVSNSGETEIRGRRDALRIRLEGTPVGIEAGDQDFEIFRLRGDVEVFLDPVLRMPIQITGHIRYLGKGHVRLQRVVTKE